MSGYTPTAFLQQNIQCRTWKDWYLDHDRNVKVVLDGENTIRDKEQTFKMSPISPIKLAYNFQGLGKYSALNIPTLLYKNPSFVAYSQLLLLGFAVFNLI